MANLIIEMNVYCTSLYLEVTGERKTDSTQTSSRFCLLNRCQPARPISKSSERGVTASGALLLWTQGFVH